MPQFANYNDVYFEFHPKFRLFRDLLNKDILLHGSMDKGLYMFNNV